MGISTLIEIHSHGMVLNRGELQTDIVLKDYLGNSVENRLLGTQRGGGSREMS